MRIRRTLVTGALIATFVVGGSGAAVAAGGAHGNESCGRGAHELERMQKKLERMADGKGGGAKGKAERLAARKAKLEQRIASTQADCKS